MIKIKCDLCEGEGNTSDFFCEIVKREKKNILLPYQKGQPQSMIQLEENRYHLCIECFNKLSSQFKKEK